MKFRVSILLAAAWLALAAIAWGADDNLRRQFQPALKSMELNRYLIARLEKEHAELVSLVSSGPSPALKAKAENYALMVRSLKEDQEKLMASLPETLRIEEFAKDIAQKKAAAKFPKIASRLALRSAPTISQRHETALKLFEENRYDEATAAYEEIILQNPNDDEAYVLLGHVLLLSGQYEKAGRAFQMAEDIDPGNRTNILSFYEDFSLQDPEDDEVRALLGYTYLIFGDPLKAEAAFKESLAINPQNEAALEGLGFIPHQTRENPTASA